MKKVLLCLILFFCFVNIFYSQKCRPSLDLESLKETDPLIYNKIKAIEKQTASYIEEQQQTLQTTLPTIYVPVVVHVLWSSSQQNISDAQIQSQIDVLNEDYNRLNADRTNTPAPFSSVASSAYLTFVLACVDPAGNQTNGITRTHTDIGQFQVIQNSNGTFDEIQTRIKYTNLGGCDAWPRNRYLNLWVCNLAPPWAGYTPDPGEATEETDGVVVKTLYFGRIGTLSPPYDKGRIATHEIGHWLNLRHLWGLGSNNTNCIDDDLVSDTPVQQTFNYGCQVFPHLDNCATTFPGVMFNNYMDYSDDICLNFFTVGQVNRMRAQFAPGGFRECFSQNSALANWCRSNLTLTGNYVVCSTSSTYTLNNVSPNCTVHWTSSNNIILPANTYVNPIAVTYNSSGGGWLQPTIISTCTSILLPQFQVWAGVFQNLYVTGTAAVCRNSIYTYTAQGVPGGYSPNYTYNWTYPSNWYNAYQYQNTIRLQTPQTPNYGTVRVSVTNCNGSTPYSGITVYPAGGCRTNISLFPNPASDYINIIITEQKWNEELQSNEDPMNYVINIYYQDLIVATFKRSGKNFNIPLNNMIDGTYIIEICDGVNKYRQFFLVGGRN